MGSTSYLTTW